MTDDTQDLLRLADAVAAATGPDRRLDARIAPLAGLTVVDEGHPIGRMCYDDIGAAHLLPRYTASLDAAMTLYVRPPAYIPANPRLATAEALRQRAGE